MGCGTAAGRAGLRRGGALSGAIGARDAACEAFRSLMAAFALAARDPRLSASTSWSPRTGPWRCATMTCTWRCSAFWRRYPQVHRSLHAGELAFGMVPPLDLKDHIAKAIRDGGAQRIGHGTDIAFEEDAEATMARMAREGIAVEINLTSNAVILGCGGRGSSARTSIARAGCRWCFPPTIRACCAPT
jgi:adenosine deaminase